MSYAAIIAVAALAGLLLALVVAAICGIWIDQQLVAAMICALGG